MPMLTTSVTDFPVSPVHAPSRTASANAPMCASTASTLGITSSPSTKTGGPERLRSAVCRTARSSVVLILSPRNMRSRQPSTSAWRARSNNSAMVSAVTRFLA